MTNYEHWQQIFKGIPSPQSYIDMGYYYLVSSSLQRRVWMGCSSPYEARALFPNVYIFLVGEPGIGKGLVMKPIINMLRYFTIDKATGELKERGDDEKSLGENKDELLLPSAPESTTYESLVQTMSRCTRRIDYKKDDGTRGIYGHNSIFFALEEISSLFKKNTESIVNFLITGYDCGDYRRETKTQGINQIKKCCINFLGGTTPSFMEETFSDKLLNDGMASRCWFVYEYANRFNKWDFGDETTEQKESRKHILAHIKTLGTEFGRVTFSDDANEFLRKWFEEEFPIKRPNNNLKMTSYYARKNIHVKKMAMIMHFSEPYADKVISLETAQKALSTLDHLEKRMHYALSFGGRNPLAAMGAKIIKYMISVKIPLTGKVIHKEFWNDLREAELAEVLRYLEDSDKIRKTGTGYYELTSRYGPPQIPGASLGALPIDNDTPK